MPHNFIQGIAWTATTADPLPDHFFISKSGNDANPGTPDLPFLTLQGAVNAAGNNKTFVIGDGLYNTENLAASNAATFIGNTPGNVIMQGTGSNQFSTLGFILQGLDIRNYNLLTPSRGYRLINCKVINTTVAGNANNTNERIEACRFVNSPVNRFDATGYNIINNIFINSPVTLSTRSGSNLNLTNNIFDINSGIVIPSGAATSFNNIYEGPRTGTINDTDSQFDVSPGLNNIAGFDFGITRTSNAFATGLAGTNIGGTTLSTSYFQGVSQMDEAVDSNANVIFDEFGQIILGPGAGSAEVITSPWISRDGQGELGAFTISGFLDLLGIVPDTNNTLVNPNLLTLEINVRNNNVESGFLPYVWGRMPTRNADGTSNGNPAGLNPGEYNWSDNQPVIHEEFQFRLTVRDDYNQA